MLENNATTLWEHWAYSDNTYSHNHPMFGSVSQWFYNWLGGIQPHPAAIGFDQIIIRPQIPIDLQWVNCSYDSIRGKITSNWRKADNSIIMDINIPANTEATVYLPRKNNTEIHNIQSGKYHFVLPYVYTSSRVISEIPCQIDLWVARVFFNASIPASVNW